MSPRPGKMQMSRETILLALVQHARANGFEFRRWFVAHVASAWPGVEGAVAILNAEGRYYALAFSHDFARALWKKDAQMNILVPSSTYLRKGRNGEMITIQRKPFIRRTIKADVWKYHIRQMALSEDPILYLRRFLPTHEDLAPPKDDSKDLSVAS